MSGSRAINQIQMAKLSLASEYIITFLGIPSSSFGSAPSYIHTNVLHKINQKQTSVLISQVLLVSVLSEFYFILFFISN